MNIEYLTQLRNNPSLEINRSGYLSAIKGIPLSEIEQLELTWNNGNPFPKSLRELLYLAGDDCYLLNKGIFETQQKLQESIREDMVENDKTISRPFYVVDTWNADQFYFIYLDEGNNPNIYEANAWDDATIWFRSIDQTIKSLIENGIERVKRGENPF